MTRHSVGHVLVSLQDGEIALIDDPCHSRLQYVSYGLSDQVWAFTFVQREVKFHLEHHHAGPLAIAQLVERRTVVGQITEQ